jgi:tetratricopeptide (TPR) repeat protein
VLSDEPTVPSRERSGVPRDLDTIVLTCLEKDPRQRYSSAAAVADDLRRFLDGLPILARPVSMGGRCWRWTRRNPRVAALLVLLAIALGTVAFQWRRSERLLALTDSERAVAEESLHRFRVAADEFAGLLDQLDTNQLFNLRAAPLRRELLLPALERTQANLERVVADPNRQSEVVQVHFRVAILTRLLSNDAEPQTRRTALEAGQKALAALDASAERISESVQFRRDRAALTHNQGYLLHAIGRSADALPILESACRQRQELLDAQPTSVEFRSELAGCWNDVGLALYQLNRDVEALAGLDRAVALQNETMAAAPEVTHYRRLLANHHFNRATTLCRLGRTDEAVAAAAMLPRILPYDPEQRFREARILAQLVDQADGTAHGAAAVVALRRALALGLDDQERIVRYGYFEKLNDRVDYQTLVKEVQLH